jgi:hypothetical protein
MPSAVPYDVLTATLMDHSHRIMSVFHVTEDLLGQQKEVGG